MTLDEKLKHERIKRFLLPGDIQNILKYGLTRDELVILGMRSPHFSQIKPAGLRKATLRSMANNKIDGMSAEVTALESLTLMLSGEIYNQQIGTISSIVGTDDGPIDIVGIITPNDYEVFTKDIIKLLDQVNQRYISEVEQSTYAALKRKLTRIKKETPKEIHRWVYALATSEKLIKNMLAVEFTEFKLAKEPVIQFTQEEYRLLIKELATEAQSLDRQREELSQQINELNIKIDTQAKNTQSSESERNRLKVEYERLQRDYKSLDENKKSIEAKLKDIESRPTGNVEELSERIQSLETEKDDYQRQAKENLELAESYDAENRRLKARVIGLNRLLAAYQETSEEEVARQPTLEEKFVDADLDYELIDAIVVGGSQKLTRVGNITLTRTNWRKNTLGKLGDKSKINMFEETIDMLIRKGIIMVNPSQRGTISVNPRVNEIEDNLLKEYLSEALNNYK